VGDYLRIGIDARLTSHGIGTYIEELVKHLALIDKKNEFIVFVPSDQQVNGINTYGDNFRAIKIKAPIFTVAEQFLLPVYISKEKLDIFHATSYPSPIIRKCPLVVTIHDLTYKVNADFYPHFNGLKKIMARNYYNFMNWYSVHFSSHIITVSEYAKKTIMNFYPMIHSKKISVIYNGVSSDFRPSCPAEIKKMKTKFKISGKYILFVGTFNPGKNLIGLINAFAGLKTLREKKYKLIIASKIDPRYPLPLTLIEKVDIKEHVMLLDYVAKEELRSLYSAAEVLVLPSLHESFGLPILEAFACGTPVITSDITALPEIAADAALLIRPHDSEQLRSAIVHIISNKHLRSELVERGYNRIKQFSWEVAAEKVLKIYSHVHKEEN
jgi:glycosyltransferase involved in cell wall biosynthesis